MNEYQKHIASPFFDKKGVAVCGTKIEPLDFHFEDIDHAFCSIEISRFQPCPDCTKVVIETFQKAV